MSEQAKNDAFRLVLAGEHKGLARFRSALGHVPSSPRCKLCMAPFSGVRGRHEPIDVMVLRPS